MVIKNLIKIARELGKVTFDIPGVSAVAMYGSIVSGFADKHSDINLVAICSKIPKPEVRRKLFEKKFRWIIFKNDTVPKWRTKSQDFFFAQGKHVSIVYKTLKSLSQITDEIEANSYVDREIFRDSVVFVVNTKVVRDPEKIFAKLRKKIPKATPKLLKYFLPSLEHISLKNGWPYSSFRHALDRKNYFYIDQMIDLELENLLICLHAINNKHYTSPKWAMKSVRSLKVKPLATVRRIQKIVKLSNSDAHLTKKINLLQSIVIDLNKLIIKERVFGFLE